jgi:heme-degrading monooxygenase HmoA
MGDLVTKRRPEREHLLRWYPATWRDRYGEELLALMEDEWGEGTPSLRYRRDIARAGIRERLHATGLVGRGANASVRLRSGSLLVLSTWTLFVIAGIGLQKSSEHFARAMPLASRATSQDAFDTVTLFAGISLVAVLIGVAVTVPAAMAFLRSGGWRQVRRPALRSVFASILVVASVIPLSLWAHRLTEFQRNGGDQAYSWAINAWALLLVLALASWTSTAIALTIRLALSRRVLRIEGFLAIVVAGSMAAITCATVVWWDALAAHASWFLQDTPAGTSSTSVSSTMVAIVSLMSIAVFFAIVGVVRITGSWRQSSTAPPPATIGSLEI